MRLLTLTLWLITSTLFAQRKTGITIYQNTDFFNTSFTYYGPNRTETEQRSNFNRLSVAIDFPYQKFVHEIEVFVPEFSKELDRIQYPFNYSFRSDTDWEQSFSSFAFRYEIVKQITKKNGPLLVSFGIAINPSYTITKSIRKGGFVFPATDKIFAASLNFIPRLTYVLSERIHINLNVPIKTYDFQYFHQYVENPNVPIDDQKDSNTEHVFFEDVFTIRFGLTYRF